MKRIRAIGFMVMFLMVFTSVMAYGGIVGKWGYVRLDHVNDGIWSSTAGTLVFNSDGTGTDIYKSNDNGTLESTTQNFTYTTTSNQDGSITISAIYEGETDIDITKLVLSHDGTMAIVDSITSHDATTQAMMILMKMDTSKTYSNADLNGDFYGIGYDYDSIGTDWPGHYVADSSTGNADGNGHITQTFTWNGDGIIRTGSFGVKQYIVNPDGSINGNGFLSGDGKLSVHSSANKTYYWEIGFGMKKGDKTYSTSDIAGTWAVAGFGDDNGNSFNAGFGTMTCDSSGSCVVSGKNQRDGNTKYEVLYVQISVAPDGSFGASIGQGIPYYAGAIGNNGNTIIINVSFNPTELYHREIFTGVRCSACYNLSGQRIPMITFNKNQYGNGLNIYLYDTASEIMDTVKQNTYSSWMPGINTDQTKMVYTEGIKNDPYTIKAYDIASKTTSTIATATARRSAYFDKNGKILFIDSNDSVLKKMDINGTNITTVAIPEFPYSFSIYWMSPDREKILVVENKREGDYYTTNYSRLVLMNADGTNRAIIKEEFLGDWNSLSWNANSSKVLYYYHIFNVVNGVYQGKAPKYVLIDIPDGTETDLSNSDIGKEENLSYFTKWGNLLSLSYRELYNGETGSLIRDVSGAPSYVPSLTEAMFGWDYNGEIYFANLDGSNFRRFVEPLLGDINSDGVVDISDVILDLRIALALDPNKPCSDINKDTMVDISDVILTLRMALGLDALKQCS